MKMFEGMFGKVASGMCRLSMGGGIAVKTSTGYKSYNVREGVLNDCDDFVFDIGEEFFYIIPTNKVEVGDIILVDKKPRCVVEVKDKNKIEVINYENSTIETIAPARHIIMGNSYFYGKIVSMFGNNFLGGADGGMQNMMTYMLMSDMMKGSSSGSNNGMAAMMMMSMMGGGGNPFAAMMNVFNPLTEAKAEKEDK